MILLRLMGGLGNQMFQYAFAISLAKKNNTQIKIDTTLLEDRNSPNEVVTHRDLLLDKVFTIHLDIATKKEIEYFNGKKYNNIIGKIFNKIKLMLQRPILIIEKNNGFKPEYLLVNDNVCLIGAFQSEYYFEEHKRDIKTIFSFKNKILDISTNLVQKLGKENSVAIHVRRGDYVSSPLYSKTIGALPFTYYENAIQFITEKIESPVFYIFSDDLNWCKENFKSNTIVFNFVDDEHAGKYAANYLQIMTYCKHFIISNSTYSWWGAWLSKNEDNKIVIAPQRWFLDTSLNGNDIVPNNWVKL